MDIKELVDTPFAFPQMSTNRQPNMSLPMQMNSRVVDRGPLPMFNMHMPPENFMPTHMPMYNVWGDNNYPTRYDRVCSLISFLYFSLKKSKRTFYVR